MILNNERNIVTHPNPRPSWGYSSNFALRDRKGEGRRRSMKNQHWSPLSGCKLTTATRFNGPVELVVIDTWRGSPAKLTPSLPGRSAKAYEWVGISQSTSPVLEEPIGTTFTVNELNCTGIGRGVDQGGQGNDGNSKSAVEDHCVVERRIKVTRWLPINTQLLIYNCRRPPIDQMVPRRHIRLLIEVKLRQEVTRHTADWRISDQVEENPPRGLSPSISSFFLPSGGSSAEYTGGSCPFGVRRSTRLRIPSPYGNTVSGRDSTRHSSRIGERWEGMLGWYNRKVLDPNYTRRKSEGDQLTGWKSDGGCFAGGIEGPKTENPLANVNGIFNVLKQ